MFSQCYDVFIIFSLLMAYTAICLLLRRGVTIPPYSLWYQISLLSISLIYYVVSVNYGGQTLGMKAWRLRLVSLNKHPLTPFQIMTRVILFFPSLILGVLYLKSPARLLRHWSNTTLIDLKSGY